MKNRDYKIVIEFYRKNKKEPRRRFAVGIHSLKDYIGETRADYYLRKARQQKENKKRYSVQGVALVDIYLY